MNFMKFRLRIGDRVEVLEWKPEGSGSEGRAVVQNQEYRVRFQRIDDQQIFLEVNGRPVRAFLARGAEGQYVFIKGRVYGVREEDQETGRKKKRDLEEAPGEVTPPMPAVVVRILVREGETVAKGQGLVVVTAMKMETTLKAPFDGVVKQIKTTLQAKVMPGDQLVEIEERKAS